jgi:lysozyme family protein
MNTYLPIVQGGSMAEDLFPRVMAFISRWEGGFVNHPSDPGGATNMGITIGTLTRWRTAQGRPKPTVEDVRNLTRAEADAIYRAYYWGPSGAAKATDYATALLLMDSGVLHGVGAPQAWVKEYGYNAWAIAARRLRVYTASQNWATFGRGWTNRVADLLVEMGKS